MKYFCRFCGKESEAKTFESIVENGKLCSLHVFYKDLSEEEFLKKQESFNAREEVAVNLKRVTYKQTKLAQRKKTNAQRRKEWDDSMSRFLEQKKERETVY